MAFDQFFSTILGGHPDDTISQRLGRAHLAGVGGITDKFRRFVDWLAFVVAKEKDHCVNSLSGKTMAKEMWNWGGDRNQIDVDDDDSYF